MRDVACVLVDGEREIEVEYGTPAWVASMEWARFHGLDPNRIPRGTRVVRDEAGRRIAFTQIVFDEDGNLVMTADGLDFVTAECVEQGEAAPLPFPPEVG